MIAIDRPSGANKLQIAWESGLLAAICSADMISTLWLVANGYARESNPILVFYLNHGGAVCFAAVKTLLFVGPLFLLELIRRQRPQVVRGLLRVGIVAYIAIYGLRGMAVNRTSSASAGPREKAIASFQR